MPTSLRIVCLWLLSATALLANVELKNVSLQYGTSPRMLQRSWAFFNYRILNSDDEAADVEVVLRPKDQRNMTVYAKKLQIGGQADLRARMLVTVGTVEAYEVELYMNGNLITKEEVLLKLGSPNDATIYFVNDDLDLEYGNFAKNKDLDGRFKTTFVRADRLPISWNGYDHVHMVVLMRPDYAAMSQRQMDAIVDFVGRGGTVLFDDPQGIVEASETRLNVLLNMQPLRIRQIERLTALRPIGGGDVTWEDGEDMLEAAPIGDGITTLWQGELPVLRWSRYGLGTVGCMTINPSQRGFRTPESNFNVTWTHILSYGGQSHWPSSQANSHVVEALDTLTGIPIPSRASVRNILAVILITALVIIGLGHVTKRQLTAWLTLAALSFAATIGLFIYGQSMVKDLPSSTATVMHFRTWGVDRVTGDQLTSLMSKSDTRVDLVGGDAELHLRSLTPSQDRSRSGPTYVPPVDEKEDLVDRGKDQVLADPIRIEEMNNARQIDGMHLATRSPKSFAALYAREDASAVGAGPTITWGIDGPSMEPWALPAGQEADFAVLLLESGIRRLTVKNGKVIMDKPGKAPPQDVEALEKFLTGIATPAPAIALFAPATEDGAGVLPEEFKIRGRVVTLVPVAQNLTAEPLSLPMQRLVMTPKREVGSQMMMLIDGYLGPPAPLVGGISDDAKKTNKNKNKNAPVQTHNARRFLFEAALPAGFAQMQASAAHVTFVPDNRGGNIRFSLQLRPHGATDESRDIQPVRVEDNTYYFDELPEGFIDPTSGKLLVVVMEEQKTVYTNRAAATRPNAWVVQELKTAVQGTLPATTTGRF